MRNATGYKEWITAKYFVAIGAKHSCSIKGEINNKIALKKGSFKYDILNIIIVLAIGSLLYQIWGFYVCMIYIVYLYMTWDWWYRYDMIYIYDKYIYIILYIYISYYIYIYIYKKCQLQICAFKYAWIKKTQKIYKKDKCFSSFQKLCQCIIKLQTKIQITQQHNESKLKNTYRIKEIIVKGKT